MRDRNTIEAWSAFTDLEQRLAERIADAYLAPEQQHHYDKEKRTGRRVSSLLHRYLCRWRMDRIRGYFVELSNLCRAAT